MKKKDSDFIRLVREEWNAKLFSLQEEVDLMFKSKVDDEKRIVISPGLKVRSKDDKVLYKVIAVSVRGVDLRPPDGPEDGSKDFFVDKEALEKNYDLD